MLIMLTVLGRTSYCSELLLYLTTGWFTLALNVASLAILFGLANRMLVEVKFATSRKRLVLLLPLLPPGIHKSSMQKTPSAWVQNKNSWEPSWGQSTISMSVSQTHISVTTRHWHWGCLLEKQSITVYNQHFTEGSMALKAWCLENLVLQLPHCETLRLLLKLTLDQGQNQWLFDKNYHRQDGEARNIDRETHRKE